VRLKRKQAQWIILAVLIVLAGLILWGGIKLFGIATEAIVERGSDSSLKVTNIRQLVAKDNRTARTIMWQSQDKQRYRLEYRPKSGKIQVVEAKDVSFTGGDTTYVQYKAELSKLTPAEVYEYRVVTDKQKGSWHKLVTDDGKGFTAIIFSDAQSSGTYKEWKAVAKLANSKHPERKLYLNLGDQVDCGEHGYQWRMWFEGISSFAADLPMAALVGNHECYDLKFNEVFPKTYLNLFH